MPVILTQNCFKELRDTSELISKLHRRLRSSRNVVSNCFLVGDILPKKGPQSSDCRFQCFCVPTSSVESDDLAYLGGGGGGAVVPPFPSPSPSSSLHVLPGYHNSSSGEYVFSGCPGAGTGSGGGRTQRFPSAPSGHTHGGTKT